MAVCLILNFDTYLRPYEAYGLRPKDCYPPVLSAGITAWCIVVCPFLVRKPSKTGLFDDAVRLDSSLRPEVSELLAWYLSFFSPNSDEHLFCFPQAKFNFLLSQICNLLQLSKFDFSWYASRHGGPSEDRLHNTRTLPEVQRRGRWALDKNLRRYEQHGRHRLSSSIFACETSMNDPSSNRQSCLVHGGLICAGLGPHGVWVVDDSPK